MTEKNFDSRENMNFFDMVQGGGEDNGKAENRRESFLSFIDNRPSPVIKY